MKRKPPALDKPYRRQRHLSDDEMQLWYAHMGEESHSPAPVKEKGGERVRKDRASPSAPLPEGKGNTKYKPAKQKPLSPEPVDTRSRAKIRRGIWAVEATLDLHGHTKATGHAALIRFVARAQKQGIGLALIITGKGGQTGGTLREQLPRWLNESPLQESIIAYDVAGPRHGGAGAWYVRIRKKKPEAG